MSDQKWQAKDADGKPCEVKQEERSGGVIFAVYQDGKKITHSDSLDGLDKAGFKVDKPKESKKPAPAAA